MTISEEHLVIQKTREIEELLVRYFNATGLGLGKKANSLEGKLPITLIKCIFRVAGMRNKLVHEGRSLHDRDLFVTLCNEIVRDLHLLKSIAAAPSPAPIDQSLPAAYFTRLNVDYNSFDHNDRSGLSIGFFLR